MNRNFIFVFILLATLSIVYAIPHKLLKRETTFGPCEPVNGVTPPVLTVKILPDPVIPGSPDTFTISGTLDADIPKTAELIGFIGDSQSQSIIGKAYEKSVCENTECPKAKTPFTLTLDIPQVPELPAQYDILVGIVNPPETILACAVASVGATSFAKTPSFPLSYKSSFF